MSQTRKVIVLGSLAASAMLVGAMQLASGHDLGANLPVQSPSPQPIVATANDVNRAAKADRAKQNGTAAPSQTVSIKLAAFAETSFLVRLPFNPTGVSAGPLPSPQGSQLITTGNERQAVKHPVACEPSVSVLTEIAKRLQPGRCVT
ncbi:MULTISPECIES: hypothetical protein [unclassified Bradyrhizobium]|uniref:hypothetical protein n=1 Tax=unclassified Bradyrhizobium TaxID=2631580 RepID=UPI0029170E8B|nr:MULTISPECIES: hypothetical protein [unclassified Bradyrhizobium]